MKLKHAVAALAATSLVALGSAPAGAVVRPTTYTGAIAYNAVVGAQAPPRANDWSCRPSAAKPQPVVLIHGTFANMTNAWQQMAPAIAGRGLCVFAFDYGAGVLPYPIRGIADIRDSAAELAAFVDRVLAATGATEVDLVGHSQGGGALPRYYLKNLGGAAEVDQLVGVAPSNHGTTANGIGTVARLFGLAEATALVSPAVEQQLIGSSFTAELDAGGDTVAGVRYTTIVSRYDQVVTPYTNQFLQGPEVTNILLQQGCAIDLSEHLGIVYSPRGIGLVVKALDPTARNAPCVPQFLP